MQADAIPPVPVSSTVTYRPIHRGAIAALILAALGVVGLYLLSAIAVFLGHRTLRELHRDKGAVRGEGLTIAALVVGYLGLALWLLRYVLT
jgi:hypothetical protein